MRPASEPGLRYQILETAKQLFISQGYHGLAMRQIAEAVGVSKAALYYHFQDKEALFLAILESYLDQMEITFDALEANVAPCNQKIGFLVNWILSQPADQRAVIRLAAQEMPLLGEATRQKIDQIYHQKFLYRIRAILTQGMQTGELKPMDPAVATWTLLGMLYPYFYPVHAARMPPTALVAEQITSIYLDGISVKAGA